MLNPYDFFVSHSKFSLWYNEYRYTICDMKDISIDKEF